MTFVGKILVIVIMIFALLFLALSGVVFMTEQNWKGKSEALQKTISKLNTDVASAKTEATNAQATLKSAVEAAKREREGLDKQIGLIQQESNQRQDEITKQRTAVETAQENVRRSQQEAEARIKERDTALETLRATQLQANEFKLQNVKLTDDIRVLKRQLDTAVSNNRNLRDRVAIQQNTLDKAGILPAQYSKDTRLIPDVEGVVTRIDAAQKHVEISIGSDDGVEPGMELFVYRTSPTQEYLGKIQIISSDPDQAAGRIIQKIQGKKLMENDNVTTKIRSRS